MNVADIKQLFDYTEWSNNLALDAAATLTDENLHRDVGISHCSISEHSCTWRAQNGFGGKGGTADRPVRATPGHYGQPTRAGTWQY
jgi:hypothetical protein